MTQPRTQHDGAATSSNELRRSRGVDGDLPAPVRSRAAVPRSSRPSRWRRRRWCQPSAVATAAIASRRDRRCCAAWSSSTREVRAAPHTTQGLFGVAVDRSGVVLLSSAASAGASSATSATARFSLLAPVGGTMCAASPARNNRPCRIGARMSPPGTRCVATRSATYQVPVAPRRQAHRESSG